MGENDPVRFGILGCAQIARKICRAISLAPNSTLWAIASRSIDKANQFAIKNGLSKSVKVYGSYGELLEDPDVDAVYMPLPTSLHGKWAVLAAGKKKHVLLEKPTALDVADLDRILEACQSNGVQFMDGSMWYHHPRTAKIKEFLSDFQRFGKLKSIYSSSSYAPPPEFLEKDIRLQPDLDSLGALGDAGWYCIGAIMWAMNHNLPTTVTALPSSAPTNAAGVLLSCTAHLNWAAEGSVATFFCSFLAHETMDLAVSCSGGSLHLHDFIIPYQETSAWFEYTSGAKFVDMHTAWNVRLERVEVANEIPQEGLMVQEFARLVKMIGSCGSKPDGRWGHGSRVTQLVMDAIKKSIDLGFVAVHLCN